MPGVPLTASDSQRPTQWPLWHDFAALAWLIAFLIAFFAQELPNNRPLTRHRLARAWVHTDPDISRQPLLFDLIDTVDPPTMPKGPPRGWRYLSQRLPLWGAALLVLVGSWGLGVLLLRWRRLGEWSIWDEVPLGCLLGLSVVSLITLGLGLCGILWQPVFIVLLTASAFGGLFQAWRDRSRWDAESAPREWLWLLAAAPFLIAIAFGSLSPPTDFDVQEYHLGGPKEWFIQGRVSFLPHNVYTSFPFLTEMLLLCGMTLYGDWYWGGVAGQAVLAAFAPLTALGLWRAVRRWWSPRAGLLAAFIFLSTPWIYRISIIAYSEGGLTAYLFAALWVTLVAIERLYKHESARGSLVLAGLFAGSAMACKYPGLISVVVPLALAIAVGKWLSLRRAPQEASRFHSIAIVGSLAWFLLGVGLTIGPWLVKNSVETGNPVYPLAYSVFGGVDLDDALAEKWQNGHPTPELGSLPHAARSAIGWGWDIAAINDWQSPLMFGFALWSVWAAQSRRRIGGLWLYVLWLFAFWWAGTHRIDRFWVPMLPVIAWLAGVGAAAATRIVTRRVVAAVLFACGTFNLSFCVTGLGSYNAGLTEMSYSRQLAARITCPEVAWLNEQVASRALPANSRVLFVGEAEHFPATFPYFYNTVFDRSLLEEWCGPKEADSRSATLRATGSIRDTFAAHGVTLVLVNWREILRYRLTYGYTDYVHPARFAALQQAGILGQPLALPVHGELPLGMTPIEALSAAELEHLSQWAPELIVPCGAQECFIAAQVYPVIDHRR